MENARFVGIHGSSPEVSAEANVVNDGEALMENYDTWLPLEKRVLVNSNIKSSTLYDTVAIYLAYAAE